MKKSNVSFVYKIVKYFQLHQITGLKMFTSLTLIIRKTLKCQLTGDIFLLVSSFVWRRRRIFAAETLSLQIAQTNTDFPHKTENCEETSENP